jgi:hypothetical protein
MATSISSVRQQLGRVRRRLFAQTLLNQLVWCWAGALGLVTVWFLIHPLLFATLTEELRWGIIASVVGTATILAVALGWWRAPSPVTAALALDEQFGLKERVTTSLTLSIEQAKSPAGIALLADVNQRVSALTVGTRFPLRLSWTAAVVPLCAALLAVVALFYEPFIDSRRTIASAKNKDTTNPDEIAKKFEDLKKNTKNPWAKDEPKSKEDQEILKAWDKLISQPLDPKDKDQVRERLQALKPLEDLINERMADLKAQAEKNKKFADQLKQSGQKDANGPKREPDAGPAKDLNDALAKGDLDRVQQELKRLADKIEKNELNDKERKELEDQLKALKDKLDQVADLKNLKDKLREAKDAGKISQEQFDRLMEQLKAEAVELRELKEFAGKLEECQGCLKDGDGKKAAGKLADAAALLKKLDVDGKDLKQLQADQKLLQEARDAMCQGLQQDNGMGSGKLPGTLRPVAKDKDTGTKDSRQHGETDPKGPQIIQGVTRGGTFDTVPAQDVGGVFRRVAQDAREIIEQQRVPPGSEEFLQGYFNKLGGQK